MGDYANLSSSYRPRTVVGVVTRRLHYGRNLTRLSRLRSQVIDSKQPKLGLAQEFVVLLVRMRLVFCLFVCLFELVCLFYRQFR